MCLGTAVFCCWPWVAVLEGRRGRWRVGVLRQQQVAGGRSMALKEDLTRKYRHGRRVQQVLKVSLHSALREAGGVTVRQLNTLRWGLSAQDSIGEV